MLSILRRTMGLIVVVVCVLASSVFAQTPSARSSFVPPSAPAQTPAVPGDEFWDDRFGGLIQQSLSSTHGINDSVVYRDELYVAGNFTSVMEKPMQDIARWNGRRWATVGDWQASSRGIKKLLVHNDVLYALGSFDGTASYVVSYWNGITWQAISGGFAAENMSEVRLNDFAFYNDELYVAGSFTNVNGLAVNSIARWNGTTWQAVGQGLTNENGVGYGYVLQSTPDGLYVGGDFDNAGVSGAHSLALWNGTNWSAVGDGVYEYVLSLAWDQGSLYVGGYYIKFGTQTEQHIARWDGAQWYTMGSGVQYEVWSITITADHQIFLAPNRFDATENIYTIRWNGSDWEPFGAPLTKIDQFNFNAQSSAISEYRGAVYISGTFLFLSTQPRGWVEGLMRWDGTTWRSLGQGILSANTDPIKVVTTNDGVYAASRSIFLAAERFTYLARWNGLGWEDGGLDNVAVEAIAADGNDLYVARSNSDDGRFLSKRTGITWTTLMAQFNGAVTELAVANGILYVAGGFTTVNNVPVQGIAKWDGTTWSALGSGVYGVDTLVTAGADLYIGGEFTSAGGIAANNIAKWDGITWSALGAGVNGSVNAIAVDTDGTVYAGGAFTASDPAQSTNLARWRNGAWQSVGGNVNNTVNALAFGAGGLYVGGRFTEVGTTQASRIARYDGQWHALGSGISLSSDLNYGNYGVTSLASNGRNVYVGGYFRQVGQSGSAQFAVWHSPTGPNAQPVASADTATTFRARPIEVAVLNNDWDMDDDALTITAITPPANGTATVVAGTHVRYTPPTDFVGTATVQYTVSDNHGGSATSTLTITVAPRQYVFLPAVQR